MNKNPQAKKSWAEIEIAIATTAITGTLALWNLFAVPVSADAAEEVAVEETTVPQVVEALPAALPTAVPQVKIFFGGAAPEAPQPSSQTVSIQPAASSPQNSNNQQPPKLPLPKKKKKSGSGGGTGTSKP